MKTTQQTSKRRSTRISSSSASRHLQKGVFDGRAAGIGAHRVIGDIVRAGLRQPSPIELRRAVAQHPAANDPSLVYRQAAKQRLTVAAAVYFRLFCPSPEWELVGVELTIGSSRLDLVWEGREGVVVDEVKSSRHANRFEREALEKQLAASTREAGAAYGERFLGIRVCFLAAPTQSFLVSPGGEQWNLEWEAPWQ